MTPYDKEAVTDTLESLLGDMFACIRPTNHTQLDKYTAAAKEVSTAVSKFLTGIPINQER